MSETTEQLRVRLLEEKIKELKKEIENLEWSKDWYKYRVREFRKLADKMPEPFKTLSIDIIANGKPRFWGVGEDIDRYTDLVKFLENMLKELLTSYRAAWFYRSVIPGYQCSFCGAIMNGGKTPTSSDSDSHKEDCPLPGALKWINSLEDDQL
jgi:hypothetical protein